MELQNRPDWQLLAKYASQTPLGSTIIEIGTHLGDTALVIAEAAPWAMVFTIDTGERWVWEGNKIDDYESFLENRFEGHEIYFLQGSSHFRDIGPVVEWESGDIDLLPIDGDHNYDAVMQDLIRWAPKVKVNGYMLLHDYVLYDDYKVYGAVQDYFAAHDEWEILELADSMLACQRAE